MIYLVKTMEALSKVCWVSLFYSWIPYLKKHEIILDVFSGFSKDGEILDASLASFSPTIPTSWETAATESKFQLKEKTWKT